MNLSNAYKEAVNIISAVSEDCEFDAMCLLEKAFSISRTEYYLNSEKQISEDEYRAFISLAKRRALGEPLQYILGEWEFMGKTFLVGEGVLIPRPETEMIAEEALKFLKNKKSPVVFDLCAGSGCIGVTVASERKDAKVYLLEKSDKAAEYLEKNIALNKADNAVFVKGDLFESYMDMAELKPDLILSNPPYIESSVISSLQKEVQREPHMALDGGEDGLDFYRALSEKWIDLINDGGMIIIECGEGQADDICKIFSENPRVKNAVGYKDFGGSDRMVTAEIIG